MLNFSIWVSMTEIWVSMAAISSLMWREGAGVGPGGAVSLVPGRGGPGGAAGVVPEGGDPVPGRCLAPETGPGRGGPWGEARN